jgi:hypothetical protein
MPLVLDTVSDKVLLVPKLARVRILFSIAFGFGALAMSNNRLSNCPKRNWEERQRKMIGK